MPSSQEHHDETLVWRSKPLSIFSLLVVAVELFRKILIELVNYRMGAETSQMVRVVPRLARKIRTPVVVIEVRESEKVVDGRTEDRSTSETTNSTSDAQIDQCDRKGAKAYRMILVLLKVVVFFVISRAIGGCSLESRENAKQKWFCGLLI